MKLKLPAILLCLSITHISFSQLQIENIKIDTTITGFHFAANMYGTIVYTPNGKSDITNTLNPTAFSFTVMPNATLAAATKEIENFILMSKQNGYVIRNIERKDTIVNGYKTFIVSYTEADKGTSYQNLVFNAVVMKGTDAVIFVSGDLDKGKYLDGIKKTFFAVRY
jgi:hypothetical protein